MNINLELYKVFCSVAKNKNITRTANELSISQPAISKSIKTLEEQTNVKLFIRERNGVILTDIGEKIYNKVKEAMEIFDSIEIDLQNIIDMNNGTITIGASKTILHEYLMEYIEKFHDEYPNIKIKIITDKTSELIKKAKMGIIDINFINMPYQINDDFEEFKLMNLHDSLFASNKFEYLKDKKITNKDLEHLPLLILDNGTLTRNLLDDYCKKNKIKITPKMEFVSNTLIKEFTEAGFGIGMLTKEHVKDEINNNKLFELNTDFNINNKYLAMVYDKYLKNTIARNFIKYIKNNTSIN